MTLEREVHPDLRDMLMSGDYFQYAHLIKFERPSRPDSTTGKPSTAAVRYTYLTDASVDIGFDDASKNPQGVNNGTQTYLANKVLKISDVSESIEAKASNFSITLDGNAIGANVSTNDGLTVTSRGSGLYDIRFNDPNIDMVDAGFREGDKIKFGGAMVGEFNIHSFRAGQTFRIKKIDENLDEGFFQNVTITLTSEEIRSILMNKNDASYSSFINREVFIYRTYRQDGITVGTPLLLFKGIISNVNFSDGDNGIEVQWGLTSHWGDFSQVRGRLSSDDFHRALDQNGNPQPESALKPEYAYDKGFIHSETSINMLAKYVVSVEKQKIKTKKGFLGLGAKVKVKKYYVNEDRFTELDFQLAARAIPLHYGVRITEGFPVFADTLKNDSSTVYVIYALGEGPIGAIYDVIVDGKPLICTNKGDFDARSQQTADDTVDIICRGRADRGDVLQGTASTNAAATPIDYYAGNNDLGYNYTDNGFFGNLLRRIFYQPYVPPTTTAVSSTGRGIIDGESIALTSPIDMTLDFFAGREGQKAASQLVAISQAKNFKIQQDYWSGSDTPEYWGPDHTLTDTAYALVKYKISEGETSIPSLEFVIKSKIIECYNYDFSYLQYDKATGESAANFALGSVVDILRSDNNAVINSQVQIIDKWNEVDADGVVRTRFRFSEPPNLNYQNGVPTITKFYMKQGTNTWTMVTYNFVEHSGVITTEMITTVTPQPGTGGGTTVTLPPGETSPTPIYGVINTPIVISGPYTGGVLEGRQSFVRISNL